MPSLIGRCGGGGSGLQFDTSPQTGDWFFATVTGSGPNGWAWETDDPNGNGWVHNGVPFGYGDINEADNGANVFLNGGGWRLRLTGNQSFTIQDQGVSGNLLQVENSAVGQKVGFFNATPVVKQPTPVVLADVIAVLQAFGLCV